MSASEGPALEEQISEVPRRVPKRYLLLALVVAVAIVLGLRRARSKPVVSDTALPESKV